MDKSKINSDYYESVYIGAASVASSFLVTKLTGHQLGVDSQSLSGALKAFATISGVGLGIVYVVHHILPGEGFRNIR